MLVSDFDFHLPDELIARQPLGDRAAARMLHLDRAGDLLEDRSFREFPDLLRPDDLLVFNNTKVLPARLFGHRSGLRAQKVSQQNPASKEFLRGKVEVLLTKRLSESPMVWEALVRPGRKIGVGERLYFGGEVDELSHETGVPGAPGVGVRGWELAAEIVDRGFYGERRLRFDPVDDFYGVLNRIGHIPLPPYIDRPDTPEDREQYQTVYAKPLGSVAAPTAGLHFTTEVLDRIRRRGIETAEITLHVGLGTFQPVRAEVVERNILHKEWYEISEAAAEKIQRAREKGRRVVAVGTTTVRTLEFAVRTTTPSPEIVIPSKAEARSTAAQSRDMRSSAEEWSSKTVAQSGEADIFIYPGFDFQVVGAMLTNFHLPKSTLLMLVSALAGRERVLRAYEHAVRERYRFYSYGDCMFVE